MQLAIDRPEVARLHFARAGTAGFDRGLVHGLDAAGTDRRELRLVDRREQRGRLRSQLREPGAADRDARVSQALMLAVQRQVPGELVEQQPDQETHVGATALEHPGGRRRAVDRLRVAALDDRAHVLEDHVAARALRQAVAHLLADHLELVGGETLGLGVGERDGLDRHARLVEEQRRFILALGEVGARRTTGVSRHGLAGGVGLRFGDRQLAQIHLRRVR